MDLEKFYDEYWANKDDTIDYKRLDMMAKYIEIGHKVLEISCGAGILAEMMIKKGADVTVTDLSNVALQRTMSRCKEYETMYQLKVFKVDTDTQELPFGHEKFDIVVNNSMIEHCFFPENVIRETVDVLKNGGRFILMVPNIGHWRFRLWLLFGRFPYLENTPTDTLHLRFFTLKTIKELGERFGLKTKKVEGSAGLWVRNLYPRIFNAPVIKNIYELLTKIYPSLFARYLLIIFEK